MSKKVWSRPEVKTIEAGAAENSAVNKALDSSGKNNSGS
jgi:hypothetical protein